MGMVQKFQRMKSTTRDEEEIGHWFTSLAPLAMAFAFFFVFVSGSDLPHKDQLYVIGAAAGFAGLELYWIVRGWRRDEVTTVLLGVMGVVLAGGVAWWYVA
jgi:hypothetical protein